MPWFGVVFLTWVKTLLLEGPYFQSKYVLHWFHFIVLFVKYLLETRELLTRSRICGRNTVFIQPLIEWYWCLFFCGIFFKILLWPWLQSHFKCMLVVVFIVVYIQLQRYAKYLILFHLFKRTLALSSRLLHNLDKTWIHNINFRFCTLHQILLKK